MPIWITTLISIIQGAIKYAPDAIKFIQQAKEFISALFGAKQIDAATQDALMAHCDAILGAFQTGSVPTAWVVEPDPATGITGVDEFDNPPSEMVITKEKVEGALTCLSNAAGKTWCVPPDAIVLDKQYPLGEVVKIGPLRFFVLNSAKTT